MSSKKSPLGRNLSSMLSQSTIDHAMESPAANQADSDSSLRQLPIDRISPGPYQPCLLYTSDAADE